MLAVIIRFPGIPVRGPVRVHEGGRNVVLQLDDGQPQRGDGENLGAVHRAVPFELARLTHAELVGQVPPLVMVLTVLVLV